MDIDYDITGTTGWVSVSVQVSSDAGASYAVPAQSFTGDFGSVPAGRDRRVTWNAGADWNGTYSPSMSFKITASDAPAGMVLISAGSFQMEGFDEHGESARRNSFDRGLRGSGYHSPSLL